MPDVAITIRIPEDLKDAIDIYAAGRGLSQAAAVRQALTELLAPATTRRYELPGLSQSFTDFLAKEGYAFLLVASGRDRFHVEGRVDRDLTNEAVVSLFLRHEDRSTPFLRRDVVGWFPADNRSDRLAISFHRIGWRPFRDYVE